MFALLLEPHLQTSVTVPSQSGLLSLIPFQTKIAKPHIIWWLRKAPVNGVRVVGPWFLMEEALSVWWCRQVLGCQDVLGADRR
jgi:hypothetical protein